MDNSIEEYNNLKFSIIPLKPSSKKPLIPWRKYQERHPSPQEIEQWFSGGSTNNIGIVTGEISGVVVLDVDGDEGKASLASLGEILKTPTVKTGKGHHYYFKHPGFTVQNFVRKLPGLDFRGDGGYVVAPPSVHENGSVYEWEPSPEDVPFAEMPGSLLELIEGVSQEASSCQASSAPRVSRSQRNEINQLLGELAQAKEGTRNDTLNSVAFAFGQLIEADAVKQNWVHTQLSAIAEGIGLDGPEVKATIDSGIEGGRKKPRDKLGVFYDILDMVPEVLDRPIRLIDNKACGVTWLPVAQHESGVKTESATELVIFTADGMFFCEKDLPGSEHLDDLPLRIELPLKPADQKLLSPLGFKAFVDGDRPDPSAVFAKVRDSIDAFVSFENSLADQEPMCELVAAWIMGTYCIEAFDVVGYLWPTGERGSGKTQLLNTVSSLAYLGRTITSGSSFASIRDEADYGATIAFDDCENVRQMESEKRELLLAGNTRGTVITLKESVGDGEWRTKYVNNFAPRLFSSIGLPDPVLASRTIAIPLIATVDQAKTRRSPSRKSDWPHDNRVLVDELWMIAVAHLSELRACDEKACEMSDLAARGHDIWRMPLAVAYWLQTEHGVEGVFDRVTVISESFQALNQENVGLDLLSLVVLATNQILADDGSERMIVQTNQIAATVQELAIREDCTEESLIDIDAKRVGKMLGRLGFHKDPSHGNRRSWIISRKSVDRIAKARSISLDDADKSVNESHEETEFTKELSSIPQF